MNRARRNGLRAVAATGLYAALVTAGVVRPGAAMAANLEEAFKAKGAKATLAAMGITDVSESDQVDLVAPDIAENGAVVPIKLSSALPKTEMLAVLVEKNPNALAGAFEIIGQTDPSVSMRIKMGQSSDVIALVRADGKYYMASKEVKVTLGGCGG